MVISQFLFPCGLTLHIAFYGAIESNASQKFNLQFYYRMVFYLLSGEKGVEIPIEAANIRIVDQLIEMI